VTSRRLGGRGLRVLQVAGALLLAAAATGCNAQPAGPEIAAGEAPAPPIEVGQETQPEPAAPPTGTPTGTGTAEEAEAEDPGEPTGTEVQDAISRCHTSMLAGTLQPAEAGAGHRYAELVLRNVSGEPCRIYGYGGLQLVDEQGNPLPTQLDRVANPGPSLITLEPGDSVSASLHWTAVPHGDEPVDGPCQPTPAAAEVIPPDETDPLRVEWTMGPVCGYGAIEGSAYHQ
jgi:hypothetical protein